MAGYFKQELHHLTAQKVNCETKWVSYLTGKEYMIGELVSAPGDTKATFDLLAIIDWPPLPDSPSDFDEQIKVIDVVAGANDFDIKDPEWAQTINDIVTNYENGK